MGNIPEIPFTEIVERTQKLSRVGSDTKDKIRGVINDVYCREIPSKFDWTFLIVGSSITTTQEYHTGTVSINTGSTSVQLTNGSIDSSVVGKKIKITGNDAVYDIVQYQTSTGFVINPPLCGQSNITNSSFSIYRDAYPLAGNFDRFPKSGGVYRWAGGRKQILPEVQYANYVNDDYSSTASTPQKTRLVGCDTMGCQLVEFVPAPKDSKVYGYDYIKTLDPMFEESRGVITSLMAGAVTVVASSANFLSVPTDGTCFFRVDNLGTGDDSTWYRVIAVTNNNQLTISPAFANTDITIADYTISKAPEYPSRMHIGIVYGGCRQLTVDQNDPNAQFYHNQYASVLSDGKRIYVSRPYSQEVDGVMTDYRYRR